MQTGRGIATRCPVSISIPVSALMRNTVMLFESSSAARRNSPCGDRAKFRGVRPSVACQPTTDSVPLSRQRHKPRYCRVRGSMHTRAGHLPERWMSAHVFSPLKLSGSVEMLWSAVKFPRCLIGQHSHRAVQLINRVHEPAVAL